MHATKDCEALYTKWGRWLERIEKEQLRDLLIFRHIHAQYAECTAPYEGQTVGGRLAYWIDRGHVAFVSTALRRISARAQAKSKNKSISLRILMDDLKEHADYLTRERYCSLAKNRDLADECFSKLAGCDRTDRFPVSRLEQDIGELQDACQAVKTFVDKVVAHTDEDCPKVPKITYGEVDNAIDVAQKLFERYSNLVRGWVARPLVPLDGWDVRGDLKKIWP